MNCIQISCMTMWFSFTVLLISHSAISLRPNYYADTCPDAESIVRNVVREMSKRSPATIPGVIRLILHDCFVEGCDASIMIQSTDTNKAERDHPDNLSLPDDAFETVVKAKEAIDANPGCKNKVSCADIIVMAARDAIALAHGPSYVVELGRLDGLSSTAESVKDNLPHTNSNLDKLNAMFGALGLSQEDMVALSGAHTVGFSRCRQFTNRLSNFSPDHSVDPTLDPIYAVALRSICSGDPEKFVGLDINSSTEFDNNYFKNLQRHRGLLSSDQVLYTDKRSKPTVDHWAKDGDAFNRAFVTAITKMGRIGVKTESSEGNIRHVCNEFNTS